MSLADQIVALIETGWTNSTAIGNRVGCGSAYVRTVKQRKITAVERERERTRRRNQTAEKKAYDAHYQKTHKFQRRWAVKRCYHRKVHDIDIGEFKG